MTASPDTWSRRALNRATLARQGLIDRLDLDVVEAVADLVGLQAQEPSSPYLALWNRVQDFDAADLDRAFEARSVVKASMMRITLHAVTAADHGPFHRAMAPSLRASRVNDRRFRADDLTPGDTDELLASLLDTLPVPTEREVIESWLAGHVGAERAERAWWALRTYAPVLRSPSPVGREPWMFERIPTFEAAPDWTGLAGSATDESAGSQEALSAAQTVLARRYLGSFGPATTADFAQFTMLKRSVATQLFAALADELTTMTADDGRTLYDLADRSEPGSSGIHADNDTPYPPRLLGMWDTMLLAHADRTRIVTDEYRSLVIRRNGDVLPTVLVDGFVSGVWRTTDDGIEITAFDQWTDDTWNQVEAEATRIRSFLATREATPFNRYRRWWDRLADERPDAQRRLVA